MLTPSPNADGARTTVARTGMAFSSPALAVLVLSNPNGGPTGWNGPRYLSALKANLSSGKRPSTSGPNTRPRSIRFRALQLESVFPAARRVRLPCRLDGSTLLQSGLNRFRQLQTNVQKRCVEIRPMYRRITLHQQMQCLSPKLWLKLCRRRRQEPTRLLLGAGGNI